MREVRPYGKEFGREERLAVNELIRGRTNAVDTVTLDAGATTTVVSDTRVTPFSRIFLFPRTANAATAFGSGSLYIATYGDGTYTITHPNTADVDKTFSVLIMTGAE